MYRGNLTPKSLSIHPWSTEAQLPYYAYSSTMYWPEQFYMFKDYSTSEHIKLRVYVQKWVGSGCQSDQNITNWINNAYK